MRKYIAEMIGTMILVICGCGTATLLFDMDLASFVVGTSLAFGLTIVALAYTIGDISGCHVNPAVSFAVWISKKMSTKDFIAYFIFQVIGAIIGAAILYAVFATSVYSIDYFSFGTNGYGDFSYRGISAAGALITEIVLTFIFVLAILGVTAKQKTAAQAGIVIGLALALVNIVGIPLTGTSVNPARSIGPAIISLVNSSDALGQVWVFIIAPLIGAAIAALLWKYVLSDDAAEQTE